MADCWFLQATYHVNGTYSRKKGGEMYKNGKHGEISNHQNKYDIIILAGSINAIWRNYYRTKWPE